MNENIINVIPNATSLIESMRSIGYSFETAIADIIDNSISANAKVINIYQREFDGHPYVQIIDNGIGMDKNELIEAMRLGSKNPIDKRDEHDLGRFGLGLKSASFSQCRTMTVISKKNNNINGYQWDLDLIQSTNQFSIRELSVEDIERIKNIDELKGIQHGTIVQWEKFDRISESASDLSNELSDLMNKTIEHISLIFHRFLDDDIEIKVNYEPILAKDPFMKEHNGTQELKDKKIFVEGETIYLYPFVLPHFSKMSAADKRKSGKTNEQQKSQGFYLYRSKRLIVWGNYLGLAKKTELGKNVRIRVDIPNSLDYIWEIDVKKSRANVPSKIKKNLLSAITDGENVSRKVNTYRGKKELSKEKPLWQFFTERDENFYFEINKENEIYQQFIRTLNVEQKGLFNILSKALAANIPFQTIYSQIGSGKESIIQENDEILKSLEEMLGKIRKTNIVDERLWLQSLLLEEPYASDIKTVEFINKELEK